MHCRGRQEKSKVGIMVALSIVMCAPTVLASNRDKTTLPVPTNVTNGVRSAVSPQSDPVEDFTQGQAYANQKKYKQAIEAFDSAEAKGLQLYELFIFRGLAHHEMRQFQKAKRDAETAVELQPSKMLGYELLAGAHYAMGSSDRAIADLTNGLTKVEEVERAKLHKARGILFLRLGHRDDAVRDLTRALELGHAPAVLYYNRGLAYMDLGRYELAIQDFSEAIRIEPGHYRSLRDRGWVYGCIGQFKQGIDDFDRVLALDPKDIGVHGMRGYVRLEAGDGEGSLADFVYALKHGSRDPWTFLNAASAYYAHDRMEKALEVNDKGLSLKDPDSESALQFQRGLFLLVSGRTKEAATRYNRAKAIALKRTDSLQLQEAIGDLKEEIQSRPRIANAAATILKDLENTLALTKTPLEPASSKCQRLRKRDEVSRPAVR